MIATYGSDRFRKNIRQVLDDVEHRSKIVAVERWGNMVGVFLPKAEWDEYQQLKRDRQAQWNFANNEFVDITDQLADYAS